MLVAVVSVSVKVALTVVTPAPDALTVTVDVPADAELTTVSVMLAVVIVPTVVCVFEDTVTPAGRPVTLTVTASENPPARATEAVIAPVFPIAMLSAGAPSEMMREPDGGAIESPPPPEQPRSAAAASVAVRLIARMVSEGGMSRLSSGGALPSYARTAARNRHALGMTWASA